MSTTLYSQFLPLFFQPNRAKMSGVVNLLRFQRALAMICLSAGFVGYCFLYSVCLGQTRETGPFSYQQDARSPSASARASTSQVERELGLAATSEDSDPLVLVLELMKESQVRLARKDTGEQTRQIQSKIVGVFDALLSQAMQSAQPQPSAGTTQNERQEPEEKTQTTQAQPRQETEAGSQRPTQQSGISQRGELNEVLPKVWGELPERERNAVLQHAAEAIVPKYRALIESYYRELSRARESSP